MGKKPDERSIAVAKKTNSIFRIKREDNLNQMILILLITSMLWIFSIILMSLNWQKTQEQKNKVQLILN